MKKHPRFQASPLEASLHAVPANSPLIGRKVNVRGCVCRISKVLPAGTIECESECGQYAFRVSGLDLSY